MARMELRKMERDRYILEVDEGFLDTLMDAAQTQIMAFLVEAQLYDGFEREGLTYNEVKVRMMKGKEGELSEVGERLYQAAEDLSFIYEQLSKLHQFLFDARDAMDTFVKS